MYARSCATFAAVAGAWDECFASCAYPAAAASAKAIATIARTKGLFRPIYPGVAERIGWNDDRSHRLVNDPHLLLIHSTTVHLDFGDCSVDLTKIRGGQLDIDCCQVLTQVIDIACAGDWDDPRFLC